MKIYLKYTFVIYLKYKLVLSLIAAREDKKKQISITQNSWKSKLKIKKLLKYLRWVETRWCRKVKTKPELVGDFENQLETALVSNPIFFDHFYLNLNPKTFLCGFKTISLSLPNRHNKNMYIFYLFIEDNHHFVSPKVKQIYTIKNLQFFTTL